MPKHDIVILIPCFNEEKTILHASKIAKNFADVLVADDSSTDNTKEILIKNKIKFFSNRTNQGYEKNLISGFKYNFLNFKKKKSKNYIQVYNYTRLVLTMVLYNSHTPSHLIHFPSPLSFSFNVQSNFEKATLNSLAS